MSYDRIQQLAARQQLRLLGGELGSVDKNGSIIENALILVQKNIEVVTESGLRTERRNIASLLIEEVGTISRGHKLILNGEQLDISSALDSDGYVVRVVLCG